VVFRLYSHWYGHPQHALAFLRIACEASAQLEKELTTFAQFFSEPSRLNAEFFVGKVMGAAARSDGMAVRLDGDWDASQAASLTEAALGDQCDLEWVYHVDLVEKSVAVFGYANRVRMAIDHLRAGLADLADPYVLGEMDGANEVAQGIQRNIQRLQAAGFSFDAGIPSGVAALVATPSST